MYQVNHIMQKTTKCYERETAEIAVLQITHEHEIDFILVLIFEMFSIVIIPDSIS